MRWKTLLITAIVSVVIASVAAMVLRQMYVARQPPPPPPTVELPDALIVFCFHGTVRSEKCKKIEAYTHEVLEKSFAAPLKEGKIVWRVLNYEEPDNAQFKNELQITGSCIVIADARSGRPTVAAVNLQKKVDELVGKKEAFMTFVRGEIEKALK